MNTNKFKYLQDKEPSLWEKNKGVFWNVFYKIFTVVLGFAFSTAIGWMFTWDWNIGF